MKRLLLTILAFLAVIAVNAEQVSKQEALQKAQQFMPDKQFKETTSFARSDKPVENEAFYIFNAEDKKGFVIVSGDDRTEPILGYSDTGCLDLDSLPPNLKGWLEGYSKQIKALMNTDIVGNRAFSRSVTRAPKAAIAPLVTTKWGQDDPYNMNCPDYFDQGEKSVTGCVATAMAQVMYYHRTNSINKTTAEIPGYNCKSFTLDYGQITVDAIPEGSIIDWDNMLDSYDGSETVVQKEAVANLMLYCGVALKMDYSPYSSEAYVDEVPVALKQYFNYSEHTKLVYRHEYTDDSWDELIYSELSKGNPVLYSGSNESAGHAFVCDGYDGNGYYHINWGWGGLSDSFFLLSALTPDEQGIGGSSAGFNDGQSALVGAVPNGEIMRLTSQSVSLTGSTSFTLNGTQDVISVPLKWKIGNQSGSSHTFDHAIGLYSKGELVNILNVTGTSEVFSSGHEITIDASVDIDANHAPGIYQLYALSKIHGENKWFRNENSSDSYITLVVQDGSMSLYVGKPAAAENVINFADDEVKRICVENWDTDGDGEISYEEAASVTDFGGVFMYSYIRTFDEAQYFTGITSFGLSCIEGEGCRNLTSIKLPSSLTSIREGAFYGCVALKSIDIPTSVKDIGRKAFQACFSMQEIVLHEGLETINDEAFYKCYALSSINIPSSVTLLGDNLCFSCNNLNDFYVDANNPYYCAIDGVLFTKDMKKLLFFPVKREGVYNIPEGTEIINSYAFATSRLESVIISKSVTKIEDYAFHAMQSLNEISIPSTVTSIGKWVLSFCTNIKKVVLEGSRQVIPERMFNQCFRLENIELPDNIESIEPYAFTECPQLTEITIPSKVTSIGDYAFAGSGLRKVRSLMQVPCAITSTVFENIYPDAILYVPEESIITYKEADNWKAFSQILTESEFAIENYAELADGVLTFYYDANREKRIGTTYDLNDKAVEIRDRYSWLNYTNSISKVIFDPSFSNVRLSTTEGMFGGCDKLTEIQGIENLNTSEVTDMMAMFQGCSSLTSIDLSSFDVSKVTSMHGMFWDCNNLKTIILPDDLTFIDSYQFIYCNSLTNISLPASVTSIGDNAFGGCTSLIEVTIPSKVTVIGDGAFANSGLTKVKSLMQTPCEINSTVFENVSNNATLIVSKGSIAKYQAAPVWKVFYRITDKDVYKLIYQVDGDEYNTVYVIEGDAITPEEAPTKEGYTFSGWSEIPKTMPANDVTITGSFTINKYNLVYMVDGDEYKSYEIEYGDAITPEETPAKKGYTFSGWSEIPETMPAKDVIVTGVFSKKMEEKETIIISGSGKITLTSSEALDFSGFEDLKAYVATGYEGSGTIWLTRIKQVPAGTPVLIKGTPEKSYEVPVMDKCVAHFENMFQGSAVEDMSINVSSADGKWNNYYMASGSFKKVTGPRTIGKGKCYLQLPASFKAGKAGADQRVKIADSGKSSYAPPVDIDLTNVEGLKAYAATGYDAANRTIWLTRIFKIQAGEGVLLKGEKGKTYTLPSADVQAYYGNMFVGNIGDKITIGETSDDGEWTNFYLASGQFKKVSGSREISTNKSYLHLPTSLLVSSARGKQNAGTDEWFMEELETETMLLGSIGGDDDGTTRIDAIREENSHPDVYYNLQGQRVDTPKKGIYIHKGRKVVIK